MPVRISCVGAQGQLIGVHELELHDSLEDLMVLLAIDPGIGVDRQVLTCGAATWTAADAGRTLQELGLSVDTTVRVASRDAAAEDAAARVRALFESAAPPPTSAPAATAARPSSAPHAILSSVEESAELQQRLYDEIQRKNIEESFINALEYTPEAFASVVMLYVDCTVNQQPVKAFVDSGAQMSILNVRTAERCGLMRLLDRRMHGMARGVGTQRIIGRVHMATVNLGGLHLPFSFSVLEDQEIDFIIGLDQLRRHRMVLDLSANCLRIEDREIAFLSEADLPANAKGDYVPPEAQDAATAAGPAAPPPPKAASTSPAPSQPVAPAAASGVELQPSQAEALRMFVEITGSDDRANALQLLQLTDWNVEEAANIFFTE